MAYYVVQVPSAQLLAIASKPHISGQGNVQVLECGHCGGPRFPSCMRLGRILISFSHFESRDGELLFTLVESSRSSWTPGRVRVLRDG